MREVCSSKTHSSPFVLQHYFYYTMQRKPCFPRWAHNFFMSESPSLEGGYDKVRTLYLTYQAKTDHLVITNCQHRMDSLYRIYYGYFKKGLPYQSLRQRRGRNWQDRQNLFLHHGWHIKKISNIQKNITNETNYQAHLTGHCYNNFF